jgi:hypothetical protein
MSGADLNERLDGINRRLQVIEMLAERINVGVDVLVDAHAENLPKVEEEVREEARHKP